MTMLQNAGDDRHSMQKELCYLEKRKNTQYHLDST